MNKVILRQEKVTIPTYEISEYDKNPMFLEKRVYQGSSGRVYPHPVCEGVSDKNVDTEYNAIFLENEYILVMILPEIGLSTTDHQPLILLTIQLKKMRMAQ